MLKFGPDQKQKPEKGSILLAEPFMDDPHFKRTVILLCEHNDEGSFGFVLNNYIVAGIHEVMDGMPYFDGRISIGGPVKNTNLYYVHTLGEKLPGSIEVIDGIFMGGDFERLKEMLVHDEVPSDALRFFVGYSGWAPEQLDDELERNSWFVTSSTPNMLMNTDEQELWNELVRQLGSEYAHLANHPQDPNLN